ncbi:MAG: TonB family protein [Betaproteobacteria bacterium]|nr:TonB family protein [Betaproteobacteria bacterium]
MPSSSSGRRPLYLALVLSLLLHAAILVAPSLLLPAMKKTPPLQVVLRPPPVETPAAQIPVPPEPLLKNTLDEERQEESVPKPPPDRPAVQPTPQELRQQRKKAEQQLRRKLHAMDFYPAEAIERNLEGDVVLILNFDAAGQLSGIMLATSSGHKILDSAAQRAVRASAANFADPVLAKREMLFTVYFRLQ